MKRLFFLSLIVMTVANTGCCRTWSQWWNRGAKCNAGCAGGPVLQGPIEGPVYDSGYGGTYLGGIVEPEAAETIDVLPAPAANQK